ncbi:MAG: hypothetical protein HY606_10010, partial [Planctomycetes bacterium]|nr:hypothetical protein [Planctomycetota bacterium]
MELLFILGGFSLGLILLITEIFLPGVVLGIIGSIIMVYSIYEGLKYSTTLGIGQILLALIAIPACILYALNRMKQKEIILGGQTEDYKMFIGKTAVVTHDLKPTGSV